MIKALPLYQNRLASPSDQIMHYRKFINNLKLTCHDEIQNHGASKNKTKNLNLEWN